MESDMETSRDDRAMQGDQYRVTRDYCYMRMEMLSESPALTGVTFEYINEISKDFHAAQIHVLESLSKAARGAEIAHTISFDQKFLSLKSRLMQASKESLSTNKICTGGLAKLPKITMKPFDGKLENWVSFKELYDSLIHNRELAEVEKLHYLLLSVQGTAYDLIKNFPLTGSSYKVAYQALHKYYDRKRNIATTYYEKLLKCESIRSKSGSELERIHRTFNENLAILARYELPNQDFMLFQMVWSKLDSVTREAFELQLGPDVDIPSFDDIMDFLDKRSRALENCYGYHYPSKQATSKNKTSLVVPPQLSCEFCPSEGHMGDTCPTFLPLSPAGRFKVVKEKRLCILCLQPSHSVKKCSVKVLCSKCNQRHHTLLHFEEPTSTPSTSPEHEEAPPVALAAYSSNADALFSTAVVLVKNDHNKFIKVRILLDSASACNFITQSCACRLGLKIRSNAHSVHGIGRVSTNTLGSVKCELGPQNQGSSGNLVLEAAVLETICQNMPTGYIDVSSWEHLKGLELADPEFNTPGPVDMLVSVNVLSSVLKSGLKKGAPGQAIAISTIFGWIVMGECTIGTDLSCVRTNSNSKRDCFFVSNLSLDESLKRFWELESINPLTQITSSLKMETAISRYMEDAYRRNSDGRLVVPLTFIEPNQKPSFSDSRKIALKRFLNLENKFKVNAQFKAAYVEFMRDYLESGHMEEVHPPAASSGPFFYIPHHGILRPDSLTTPLRTVFDASAKDSEGKSLNDLLAPGPKLQKSIFDILIRFRWHKIVFTGDIKKMYRQFLITPEDTDYQRILWRDDADSPIRDFRLLTVTYGVSCAPYQALWCMSRLASEFVAQVPLGASILQRDTYVDDVVSGADSIETAVRIRQDLTEILSSAGLHLRKWTSNSEEFLGGLPPSELYSEKMCNFEDLQDLSLKILGMLWIPTADQLTFKTASVETRCTKRSILSDIARIFDPLGLLSPVVFLAKYIMQLLWIDGVEWDEEAPQIVSIEWLKIKTQLPSLSSVALPRRMVPEFTSLQFHGFCDASERGYCAVVYCRAMQSNGVAEVQLCCAKSKVAPLRKRSIPRLELMAAVLLTEVMSSVILALDGLYQLENIVAWSDSNVVLTWIKSCPSRWKTFVANRVTEIQDGIPPDCWRHVPTTDNPADHGSRGLLPDELVPCQSWWSGPSWLMNPPEQWPQTSLILRDESAFDERKVLTFFTENNITFVDGIFNRFSSFFRIVNILAYCFRFCRNLRRSAKSTGVLSTIETNEALHFVVKHVQEITFASEIRALKQNTPNSLPKALRKLCPFVDTNGLLRVGGRLSHSDLNFNQKHPLLLPRDHRLTHLLIEDYHRRFLHPGPQTLQSLLVRDFWILSAKRAIRSVVSSCVKCFRAKPRLSAPPLMANLPSYRINQIKPFSSSSVDFAGPFDIALGRGRGVRTYKGYICVFVCTVIKAVHLELASELTSEAYLACLRRFIARRGRCSRLVSDQGTNFVGASNMLKDFMSQASQTERVEFRFNPPGSPHFSGLVEAGVKSVKTHLARVVGGQRLTYEEFNTLLIQIEALLNSRPLSPLSSDPNDLTALTPGHFLTLEPLTLLPEAPILENHINPYHRWRLIQKMHQDFWARWHLEYIHTLQQRHKWVDARDNMVVGTLVLISNEQCSPMKWKLGRVIQLHPGTDNVCRVVTLKTQSGECKRPVVKLCVLPVPQDIESGPPSN